MDQPLPDKPVLTNVDLAMSYARVRCTTVRTTLGKAEKADTDKHRDDLIRSALRDARGIVASLEQAISHN